MNNLFNSTEISEEKLKLFQYRPFVKNVYILLPGYKYLHSTSEENKRANVGRERTQNQLFNYLKKGTSKGSYLITGYRGMGKTTLVNRVVDDYIKDSKDKTNVDIKKISISFGQKNITETDVLKQIIYEIKDKFEKSLNKFIIDHKSIITRYSIIVGLLVFILTIFFKTWCDTHQEGKEITTFIIKDKIQYFNKIQEIGNTEDSIFNLEYLVSLMLVSVVSSIVCATLGYAYIYARWKEQLRIYKKIIYLYDRSTSQFTSEESVGTGAENFPILLSKRKSKAYALAGPKEISNEIKSIIRELPIRFIFIFDELDKIDTHVPQPLSYEDTQILEGKGETFAFDDHRKRKKVVLDILSSLKYLITEAEARFIFIAGSEMFDAAMADVSDRHSAISSIFGHVINVNSLYKDKKGGSVGVGITNLVEEFLTRVIHNVENKEPLESILTADWYWEEKVSSEDRLKIIYTLQHFINYLAYRSTGSPKKMIKIVEEHTRVFKRKDLEKLVNAKTKNHKSLVVKAKQNYGNTEDEMVFLSFSYYDQYKFGLLNYFYRPVIISKSRIMKKYSDSLLISVPFLMDHIHKFNGNAFSMENLELLPEVLSAGKNPELRTFLEDLIEQFKQTLIRNTETKFFDYKFYYKIYSEIVHVSTLFAEESSAYNFTLDENYNIKLYLRLKIKELRYIYKDFEGKESGNALDSIALFNTLLGDLTYFDREYSDAIGCYLDALAAMQNDDMKNGKQLALNDFHAVSYLKCTMKLALCYEKIKSYAKAISCYIDVISVAGKISTVESKYFLHEELSRYKINALFSCLFIYEKQPSLGDFKLLFSHVMSLSKEEKQKEYEEKQKIYWSKIEKNPQLLGLLAEPTEPDGLISVHFREFLLKEPIFLHNLGLLLFYRNSLSEDDKVVCKILSAIDSKFQLTDMTSLSPQDNSNEFGRKKKLKDLTNKSPHDCLSIACTCISLKKKFDEPNLKELLLKLRRSYKDKTLRPEDAFFAARNLSRLGNLLFSSYFLGKKPQKVGEVESFENLIKSDLEQWVTNNLIDLTSSDKENNSSNLIKKWLDAINIDGINEFENYFNNKENKISISFRHIFYLYLLSAKLYMYSGNPLMGTHQYRKILAIHRYYASVFKILPEVNIKKLIEILKVTLVKRTLQVASWNSSSTDRSQVYKYKHAIGIEHIFHDESVAKYNYKNVSNAPDVKEAIWHMVVFEQICNSSNQITLENVIEDNPNQSFITQSNSIHTMYARLNELEVQCVINKSLLNNICLGKLNIDDIYKYLREVEDYQNEPFDNLTERIGEIWKQMESERKYYQLPYLIANWIFCLHSMIQILQMKGSSYLFTFSTQADQYRRLGDVLKYYEFCRFLYKKDKINVDVFDLVQEMIGKDAIISMDTTSLYQLATRNYRAALSTHTRGSAYRFMLSNMYFLEDDFHDNIFHFSIAFERHKVNSKAIMDKIRYLSNYVSTSQLFDYNTHINNVQIWENLFQDLTFEP